MSSRPHLQSARDHVATDMIAVVSKLGLVVIALFVALLAWLLYIVLTD